ncbi:hypothetical protein M758_12G098900 [Ceratodon purpureus]|uniref:Expansin n=1 Tax=Ceratodon purpureus TaxID=3225 RepID=A0A8T0GB24_CERPU|nr:hypothetical protein KC19_12G095000 [Ceratodon purpureus]KAG0598760.1 hypothetical protein M758_12G098900 [Ceratodon purpureus]
MKMVMMSATSGVKLAVLFLALSLTQVALGQGWRNDGHITFYGSPNGGGTQAGACGYQNTYALGYGSMTAALSSSLFQGGAACGACFQLQCIRANRGKNWCYSYARTITVTATNLCPPGSTGGWCNPPRAHFDLPMPAFLTLAQRVGGVAPVRFRRVRCAKRGGVRFTIGGNPWFMMILIHNVGGAGDIRAVQIKGPRTGWVPMYRNWGALWTCRTKISGALTFRITTSDGRTLVTGGPGNSWRFGQTWEGRNY